MGDMLPVSRRRAITLFEVIVTFAVFAILTATVTIGFQGGRNVGSDRVMQADIDAVLDTAIQITGSTGRVPSGPSALNRVLVGSPQVVDADEVPGPEQVSVSLDQFGRVIAAAGVADDGSCWLARLAMRTTEDKRLRSYGIVPAPTAEPCTGLLAATLPSDVASDRGGMWRQPTICVPVDGQCT